MKQSGARLRIRIDGTEYEIRNAAEVPDRERTRIRKIALRYARELRRESDDAFTRAPQMQRQIDAVLERVLVPPAGISEPPRLRDLQKLMILNGFLNRSFFPSEQARESLLALGYCKEIHHG